MKIQKKNVILLLYECNLTADAIEVFIQNGDSHYTAVAKDKKKITRRAYLRQDNQHTHHTL